MPRPPRLEIPFGYYHLTARGNNQQVIFNELLRDYFLVLVDRTCERYGWRVFAYALMDNHYHLVIQVADQGLSAGMQELNFAFALESNWRFDRINHCFGKRFWSKHVETFEALLETVRYVLWNPPRAGVGRHPRDSTWTSYASCAGLVRPPLEALAIRDLFALFGSDTPRARAAFETFISEGHALYGPGRCQAPGFGPR